MVSYAVVLFQFSFFIYLSPNMSFGCIHRIIDNKSLRLITEASESSPSKVAKDYPDAALRGIFFVYSADADYEIILLFY